MDRRLFVDCDDTLILYESAKDQTHQYGVTRGEPHTYNRPLVNSIRAFISDNPHALVVVWSGGGAQYSRVIADVALPGMNVAALTKSRETLKLVRAEDIVVDDMDLAVPAKVLRPDEWRYEGRAAR